MRSRWKGTLGIPPSESGTHLNFFPTFCWKSMENLGGFSRVPHLPRHTRNTWDDKMPFCKGQMINSIERWRTYGVCFFPQVWMGFLGHTQGACVMVSSCWTRVTGLYLAEGFRVRVTINFMVSIFAFWWCKLIQHCLQVPYCWRVIHITCLCHWKIINILPWVVPSDETWSWHESLSIWNDRRVLYW